MLATIQKNIPAHIAMLILAEELQLLRGIYSMHINGYYVTKARCDDDFTFVHHHDDKMSLNVIRTCISHYQFSINKPVHWLIAFYRFHSFRLSKP